jgi:hypothetical protein
MAYEFSAMLTINGHIAGTFVHRHTARCRNEPFAGVVGQCAANTCHFLAALNSLHRDGLQ